MTERFAMVHAGQDGWGIYTWTPNSGVTACEWHPERFPSFDTARDWSVVTLGLDPLAHLPQWSQEQYWEARRKREQAATFQDLPLFAGAD